MSPTPAAGTPPGQWPRFASRTLRSRPSAIREILKVTEQPDVISFAGGLPAPELFPVDEVREATLACLAEDASAALQYGPTEGYAPLRGWASGHLRDGQGLECGPGDIVITHGSQQGLDLVAKVMIDPGDTIIVENPSYLGALQAFQAYEPAIVALPSDSEGMDPEALEALLAHSVRPPKLLYLVSTFQNPTGRSTSLDRRKALASIASRHGLTVVEDDPYSALRYSGTAVPSLASFMGTNRWVYLGTASKILTPGLRVAWLATPDPELRQRIVTAKQACDLHTSSFTQRIAHRVLTQDGFLGRHVSTLTRTYRSRRDAMLAALATSMPAGVDWTRPEGGLFLWLSLPASIDATDLLQEALSKKVAFVPGEPFWGRSPMKNTLRLNFSNASEERIREGIDRLGIAIHARLARSFASKPHALGQFQARAPIDTPSYHEPLANAFRIT